MTLLKSACVLSVFMLAAALFRYQNYQSMDDLLPDSMPYALTLPSDCVISQKEKATKKLYIILLSTIYYLNYQL